MKGTALLYSACSAAVSGEHIAAALAVLLIAACLTLANRQGR
jgi:hypothetical protein